MPSVRRDIGRMRLGVTGVFSALGTPFVQVQSGATVGDGQDGEMCRYAVDLSASGTVMVAGCPFCDEAGVSGICCVRVYEWSVGQCEQMGSDVVGEGGGYCMGYSVTVNANGDTVACSSTGSDIGGSNRGRARVFMWSAAMWLQVGTTIVGDLNGAYLGWSVALDASGSVLAVGANGYSSEGPVNCGRTTMHMWEDGGASEWVQRGQGLDGIAAGDRFGARVSMSGDGNVAATAAPQNDDGGSDTAQVVVFEWSASGSGMWEQIGSALAGSPLIIVSGVRVLRCQQVAKSLL